MNNFLTTLARETLVIGEGETVEYVNLPLDGEGMDLTISGTAGDVGYAEWFPKTSANVIEITATGVVAGEVELLQGDALMNAGSIHGAFYGVYSVGGGFTLTNTGLIEGSWGGVVVNNEIDGAGPVVLTNDGLIRSDNLIAVFMENDGFRITNGASGEIVGPWAMNLLGNDGRLVNHGLLSGDFVAVQIGGDGARLLNTGMMEATEAHSYDDAAVMLRGDGGVIASSGSILSAGPAVLTDGAGNTLLNAGLIETTAPGALAVSMSGAGAVFGNSGVVIGDVALGTGGDAVFRNAGRVEGDVSFGDGNDVYDGAGGSVSGVIRMGTGHDRAQGGGQRDVILGGGGRDGLDGGAGDDLLAGGAGADVFVFGTGSGVDVIADFGIGADRLDLTALGVSDEAEVLAEATETAQGVVIDLTALGGDGSVLLAGVALGDLGGEFLV